MARTAIKKTPPLKVESAEVDMAEDFEEVEEEVEAVETVASERAGKKNEVNNFPYKVKKQLESEPRVKIFVPDDALNPDIDILQINLSGYIYGIPRGKECEVPQSIYEIWKESYEKTLRAERRLSDEGKMTKPIANL